MLSAASSTNLALVSLPLIVSGGLGAATREMGVLGFAALVSLACLVEATASSPDRGGGLGRGAVSEAPGWLPHATGAALLLTFWAALAGRLSRPGDVAALMVLGAAIFVAGIWLRRRAVRTLGRWFSDEVRWVAGQPLVTGGIYARLRHPSEAGALCLGLGSALLLASPAGLAVSVLVLLPLVLWRVRLEDRMLEREHGDAYRGHARSVPALMPRLGRG